MLTFLNRRSENTFVEAIIVPELELRNVKMQPSCGNVKVYPLASGHHWQCGTSPSQ